MHKRIQPAVRYAALAVAATLAVLTASPAVAASGEGVGQVSLLIGQAHVVRADGSEEVLRRGMPVRVGDRIETGGNGHVHVRFIDNAAVSVRPDSSLEVQTYRYDAQRPELNEVRLNMDKGSSRSISGAATEVDKSRFRLNTPLAAIGVRGTDFIVQTDSSGVRATVSDGAIVVGALGSQGCSAAGLGPCAGAKTLTAEMGQLMAEIRPFELGTRIVPAVDLTVASNATRDERDGAAKSKSGSSPRNNGIAAAEPTGAELLRNDRAAAELLTLAAVRVPNLNRASDPNGQLIWGRYSISALPDEKLTVYSLVAQLGRQVTSVGDISTSLFRANQSTPGQLFNSDLKGEVVFGLTRASASYETGTESQAAGISAGTLTVDFTRRTFATALDLFSASGAKGELRVSNIVRPDGIFGGKDSEQFVSGAVSLDGKEAGYLFERTVGDGVFRGRTLWGK